MQFRSRIPQDNTPGGLAAELAEARSEFETRRADVIERGTQRSREIEQLQAELAEEQAALKSVLTQ